MNIFDLYVLFFIASILLLVLEIILGMVLGIALAGSITFFILGIFEYMGLIHGLNNYLMIGSILFIIATLLLMKIFRNSVKKINSEKDVNDY